MVQPDTAQRYEVNDCVNYWLFDKEIPKWIEETRQASP